MEESPTSRLTYAPAAHDFSPERDGTARAGAQTCELEPSRQATQWTGRSFALRAQRPPKCSAPEDAYAVGPSRPDAAGARWPRWASLPSARGRPPSNTLGPVWHPFDSTPQRRSARSPGGLDFQRILDSGAGLEPATFGLRRRPDAGDQDQSLADLRRCTLQDPDLRGVAPAIGGELPQGELAVTPVSAAEGWKRAGSVDVPVRPVRAVGRWRLRRLKRRSSCVAQTALRSVPTQPYARTAGGPTSAIAAVDDATASGTRRTERLPQHHLVILLNVP